MTNNENPQPHPDPVARAAIAAGRLVRRAFTRNGTPAAEPSPSSNAGGSPGDIQPTDSNSGAIDTPGQVHDVMVLTAVEPPATPAEPDIPPQPAQQEEAPAISPYSRPRPPHNFQKPTGAETEKDKKARQESWLRLDPDGQRIYENLERANAVLAYLQPEEGKPRRKHSDFVDSALASFGHDPRNPNTDTMDGTVIAANNSKRRLEQLTEKLMDDNPHNIGIGSTVEVPGSAQTGGQAKTAKITGIDQYGRLVTNLRHPDKRDEYITTTFGGLMEKIRADEEVQSIPALPAASTQSPSEYRTDGGAWGLQ
jgi:hypothetical protein